MSLVEIIGAEVQKRRAKKTPSYWARTPPPTLGQSGVDSKEGPGLGGVVLGVGLDLSTCRL